MKHRVLPLLLALACMLALLTCCRQTEEATSEKPVIYLYPDASVSDNAYDAKPVIYAYPDEETMIFVTLSNPDVLTCTYPDYREGWTVTAAPDGTLTTTDGKELYALYWEGTRKMPSRKETGFCLKSEEIAGFLEDSLTTLGLSAREREEFIIYWLPRLTTYSYVYLYFETMEEINANQTLNIIPAPDTLIRVSMVWQGLDAPISVTPQVLTPATRDGFVAVEWGGTEITG